MRAEGNFLQFVDFYLHGNRSVFAYFQELDCRVLLATKREKSF